MIDKRTVTVIHRNYEAADEKHAAFCIEKRKLENLIAGYIGNYRKERIKELLELLPNPNTTKSVHICDMRNKLIGFLRNPEIVLPVTHENSQIPNDKPLPENVKTEIRTQVDVCLKLGSIWMREVKRCDNYVRNYMKRHKVSESIEKMEELMDIMPDCFFKYLLFKQKVEMEKDK